MQTAHIFAAVGLAMSCPISSQDSSPKQVRAWIYNDLQCINQKRQGRNAAKGKRQQARTNSLRLDPASASVSRSESPPPGHTCEKLRQTWTSQKDKDMIAKRVLLRVRRSLTWNNFPFDSNTGWTLHKTLCVALSGWIRSAIWRYAFRMSLNHLCSRISDLIWLIGTHASPCLFWASLVAADGFTPRVS